MSRVFFHAQNRSTVVTVSGLGLPFPRIGAAFDTATTPTTASVSANGFTYSLISTGAFMSAYPAKWAFNLVEAVDNTTFNAGGGVNATAPFAGASIGIDFGVSITIGAYRVSLAGVAYGPESPRDWTLQGSADNSNWTTLDTHLNTVTADSANIDRVIGIPQSFRYYRLLPTTTNSGVNRWFIDGLHFFAPTSLSFSTVTADRGGHTLSMGNAIATKNDFTFDEAWLDTSLAKSSGLWWVRFQMLGLTMPNNSSAYAYIGVGNSNATPLRFLSSTGDWLTGGGSSAGASGIGAWTTRGSIIDLVYDINGDTVACRLNEGSWSADIATTLTGSVLPFVVCRPAASGEISMAVVRTPATSITVNSKTYTAL
jgi:hypothetical protein